MIEEFLRQIPLFSELSGEDLRRLCKMAQVIEIKAGELLFEEGSSGERAFVIQKGELKVYKMSSGREVLLARRGPGEVIGEIALIENRQRMASVRAEEDSKLIAISKQQLQELMDSSPQAAQSIFNTVLSRLRSTQSRLEQSEKLARLGSLTAGIAHELNNPSAAVQRSSGRLLEELDRHDRLGVALQALEIDKRERDLLRKLDGKAREQADKPPEMNALLRSDRQSELEAQLEELDVEKPWEIAPELVDLGAGSDEISEIGEAFTGGDLRLVLEWWTSTYASRRLLYEVESAAGRISKIVAALKSYVYLDQAPVQNVDLHRGLDDTLLILNNKIKQKGNVSIERDYDPDLPRIFGYGSELNQVWTNLLDNALDAVGEDGRIVIRTRADGEWVSVEIEDDGRGIPPELQDRIFEPFFTTKPVGAGTGMGLDISYNIVVQKHRGQINVDSQPGRTCFEVRLPVDFTHGRAPTAG
ncbi:MAG: ATP-binding protein [Anaerolineales bacterium]|jgi:signal transduction histidine kinase